MKESNKPMPELEKYVDRLKETFPNELGHIKSKKIIFSSFSKKSSKAAAKVGPIPSRFSSFLPECDYFIEVHKEHWDVSDEAKRLYVILHELNHIPEEGFIEGASDYRKTIRHDIEDFQHLLKTYGVELEKVNELAKKVSR